MSIYLNAHKIPWTIENRRFNEENKSTAHAKPQDPGARRSRVKFYQIIRIQRSGDILCFSMFGLTIVQGWGNSHTTMNCYWKYWTKRHTEFYEFAKTSTNLTCQKLKFNFWSRFFSSSNSIKTQKPDRFGRGLITIYNTPHHPPQVGVRFSKS